MRASKRDRNEPEIRRRAEALGFLWLENTASTKGRPDACLLCNGHTYWCEVKAPGESFTPAQVEEFPHLIAKGVPVYVLETPNDVVRLQQGALRPWAPSDVQVVRSAKGRHTKKRKYRPGYDRATRVADQCAMAHCATSRLPGEHWCATHEAAREMVTVENSLLPAPRTGTSASSRKVRG